MGSRSNRRWIQGRGALSLALLAAGACEQLIPAQPTDVLIGVPVAGADSVFVLLGRSPLGAPAQPFEGARLELMVGSSVVRLEEGPLGACGPPEGFSCYRGRMERGLLPGRRVTLGGTLPDGRLVSGRAFAPLVPTVDVSGATQGDTVRFESPDAPPAVIEGLNDATGRITISDLPRIATIRMSDGSVRRCDGPEFGVLERLDLALFTTSPSLPPLLPGCIGAETPEWATVTYPVTFLAYDENFTRWARAGPLLPEGSGSFGVDGVSGVFGAATPRAFTVVIER